MTPHKTLVLVFVCLGLAACGQKPSPAKSAAPAVGRAPAPAPVPRAAPAPEKAPAAPVRSARRPKPAPPAPAAPAEEAPGGTLHIDSDVAGAQVFIDRQYIGATPLTAPNVSPGTHQLNISAQGYNGIAQSIDVEPGPREFLFKFKEVRLDLAIDVLHKHRIGTCKGRLSATPQGLRYDTTNKDDAFRLPLPDLQMFEVDYQAKVLRVQSKKGKRYEFTDPEGSADRLFVFHRDVDAARKRLKDNQ
ncbi:MAG: PEGA domain-containing protein [Acidobacteria bacterium]|nr:PEGA domain-containing protein [Acidobacteriota bacterium]